MADKKAKVCVGLPIYGGIFPAFFFSTLELLKTLLKGEAMEGEFKTRVGDSLVSRARNNIVSDFMRTDCTHLLFLDCDLQFRPEQIVQLLNHDAPIVGALYPKKQMELGWVMNTFPGLTQPDQNGLLPVKCIGTGAMLIKREVIQQMQDAYPALRYDADAGGAGSCYDLFKVGTWPCAEIPRREFPQRKVDERYELPQSITSELTKMQDESRHLSEDWFFCYLAWNLGIPTFIDTRNVFYHWDGCTRYPLVPIPVENLPVPPSSPDNNGQRAAA
jgi:hypothetical protein